MGRYYLHNVGIHTTAPTVALHVVGSGIITAGLNMNTSQISGLANATGNDHAVNLGQLNILLGFKIGGSGTANYISKFTASGTIGNSNIFDNGTNVGIGTTTPSAKLDVSGSVYISGGLNMASQKITNVAAGTVATDAVNVGQLSGVGSKWTLSGSDIYRTSKVSIGTSTSWLGALNVNGAAIIGDIPAGSQHQLHVTTASGSATWAVRVQMGGAKNNNFQVDYLGNVLIAVHTVSTPIVELGNSISASEVKVLHDFMSQREVRHTFNGNGFGNNIISTRIQRRMSACINSSATQTQTNCNIEFNTNPGTTSNHKFLVEIEGTLNGVHFRFLGVISYASSVASLVASTTLNLTPNTNITVSIVSSKVVLTLTRTTGTFAYTNLIIHTQATGYSNGIDQSAPSVSNVTFS